MITERAACCKPSLRRPRKNCGPVLKPIENRNSRKNACLTSPDTRTPSCPIATPASSVPVTAPSVNPPSFSLPRAYPIPRTRKNVTSGCSRSVAVKASVMTMSGCRWHRWHCGHRSRRLRGAACDDVTACHGAHCPADALIDVVIQIREGDAHRPVRGVEAAAVEKDDAVVFRETEDNVEWMDVGLDPLGDVVAAVLAQPVLEVDDAVIPVEELVRRDFDAEPRNRRFDASPKDLDTCLLVGLVLVAHF